MTDRHTTIRASQLRNLSITAEDLADNSITGDKLVDVTISGGKMADESISEAKLGVVNIPVDGYYLKYTTVSGMEWSTVSGGGGTSDHGSLTGLTDDDHTQYLLTNGTRTVTGDFTVSGSVNLLSNSYKIDGDNAISFPVDNTNIAIGYNSGSALTTGSAFNTVIGSSAAANLTTGDRNQVIGYSTGYWLTTGCDNVLVGSSAGQCSNGYGDYNYAVCLGAGAGSAGVGNNSICIGYQAGTGSAGKTHTNSICIGYQAGYALAKDAGATPNGNICIGFLSGNHIKGVGSTTPNYNVIIGSEASYSTISGSSNVVIGRRAGYGIPGYSYYNNTIIGHEAGYTVSGTGNVFVGHKAGYNETGCNKLYISNSDTATPLIYGEFDNNLLKINGNLTIGTGTTINEFSTDTTLAGNSDNAVPTEKAVKTYVDDKVTSGCRVYRNAVQSIPHAAWTKIQFNAEYYDSLSEYDSTTNHRFTAQKAGVYMVSAGVRFAGCADGSWLIIDIFVNGNSFARGTDITTGAETLPGVHVSAPVKLTATDYVEIHVYQSTGGAAKNTGSGGSVVYMIIQRMA